MKPAESSIIHVIRSVTLLAILILVPGIAVFWNHLPKKSVDSAAPPQSEEGPAHHEDSLEPAISQSAPWDVAESSIQPVSWGRASSAPPPDFASLELQLKELGATYYELKKWGSQDELFRFVCLVAPSEPYSYEKHFQAIGTDAITVMQSVIADIEQWKQPHRR